MLTCWKPPKAATEAGGPRGPIPSIDPHRHIPAISVHHRFRLALYWACEKEMYGNPEVHHHVVYMIVVFWDVLLCSLVHRCQCCRGTYCPHLQGNLPWNRRPEVPLKCWYLTTKLYGILSKKTSLDTAMRTLNTHSQESATGLYPGSVEFSPHHHTYFFKTYFNIIIS